MEYGARWPEPQPPPHYHAAPHHYNAQPPPLPGHHHHLDPIHHQPPSISSYYPNPSAPFHDTIAAPPPDPAARRTPPVSLAAPDPYLVDPYAPHGGYEARHAASSAAASAYYSSYHAAAPAAPAPAPALAPSYYYGADYYAAVGRDPHEFAVKDAIRQYGMDPVSYPAVVPSGPSNGLDPGVPPQMNPYTWKTTTRSTNSRNTIKKPLKRNTTVSQSAYCEVCKIDCNSPEVLNSHKQGKKHKKNLQKLQESITRKPAKAPANTVDKKQTPAADKGKAVGEQSKRKLAPATEEDLAAKKKRVLEGGAAVEGIKVCNVCNVVVNSQKVFDYHIAGQKHAAMVKKQQEASAAAS